MRRVLVLLLTALLGGASASRADEQDVSLGLGAGWVEPAKVEGTLQFVLDGRFGLGAHAAVGIGLGYGRKAESARGFEGTSLSTLNWDVGVVGLLPRGDRLRFELGGGLGLYMLNSTPEASAFEAAELKIGGHLLAAVDGEVSDGISLFAQARFDFVRDANQFKLLGGIRFWFV